MYHVSQWCSAKVLTSFIDSTEIENKYRLLELEVTQDFPLLYRSGKKRPREM